MGHVSTKSSGNELTEQMIERLTRSTKYSVEQIKGWHRSFIRDCPSGKLSFKQFVDVYKQFYPTEKAENYVERVFKTFDLDGNGFIDFVEFLLAINANTDHDLRGKLYLAFDVYDRNGDGQVENREKLRFDSNRNAKSFSHRLDRQERNGESRHGDLRSSRFDFRNIRFC